MSCSFFEQRPVVASPDASSTKESAVLPIISREATGSPIPRLVRGAASGFTLIELLVVLVIIGLLASIALPRFSKARDKAYQTQMQNDLRSLATAEEAYFDDNMSYTNNVTALNLVLTKGVSVSIQADAVGWSAKATHTAIPAQCGMYFGSATAPSGVSVPGEGIVACN